MDLTWQNHITLINTAWGLWNASRFPPQKQIPESKTETPQQWVLYLLFLYIVISRAYLKLSLFPLTKTHIHTPCISIQAMKPPKMKHPGLSPLGWSSTEEMTRTMPLRPASHPVCLWQYSFQHTAEISSFKEENYLYISAKTLGSSTEQKTEVKSRLEKKQIGSPSLVQRRGLEKGFPMLASLWRYQPYSAACAVSSLFPLTLQSHCWANEFFLSGLGTYIHSCI